MKATDLRVGHVIRYDDRLWIVTKTQHVQPGKGGAFMQTELKGIRDGVKKGERFRSSEDIERAVLDEQTFQYLYADGNGFHFMNPESYEQISISADLFTVPTEFLEPDMSVMIGLCEGDPVWVKLPAQIVTEVIECEPSIKGQTATSSYKPAKITQGIKVMVPPHINAGTKIIVSTEDSSYCERYKE